MTAKSRYSAEDVAHATEILSRHVKPGSTIFFAQRTSKTGARRYLRAFIAEGSSIIRVTNYVARACNFRLDSSAQEIVIDGGGFSATFEVTDSLSRVLFGKGYELHEEVL